MNIPEKDLEEIKRGLGHLNNEFEGKTVLIVGCLGFLGKIFTEYFNYLNGFSRNGGTKLILVDNYIVGKNSENRKVLYHDISQPFGNLISPHTKIDFCINVAGLASPSVYLKHSLECIKVNVHGTMNVLDLAYQKQIGRTLLMSSSEIYGLIDDKNTPTPEEFNGNVPTQSSRSCYDESKRLLETISLEYKNVYNVHSVVVRPFNVYNFCLDNRVLPSFFKKILEEEPIVIYGTGQQQRTYCYITDFINGALRALLLGKSARTYNIGSKPEISLIDLAKKIKEVNNIDFEIELRDYPNSYPKDETQRRAPNLERARIELDYTPKISLEEGLKRFYDWAKENYAIEKNY